MRTKVLEEAARRNVLLNREALEMILCEKMPVAFLDTILSKVAQDAMVIGKSDVLRCLNQQEALAPILEKSFPLK